MKLSSILLSLLIGVSALPCIAQSSKEETLADLNRTGGVYYAYPVTSSTLSAIIRMEVSREWGLGPT